MKYKFANGISGIYATAFDNNDPLDTRNSTHIQALEQKYKELGRTILNASKVSIGSGDPFLMIGQSVICHITLNYGFQVCDETKEGKVVVNEHKNVIKTVEKVTPPKSKKSYQLIVYLDNASPQNVIGDNFKILVYNSNDEPILSAKPNVDFNDDHQKISPPKGYPIIYQSGQYPEDIRVCAQQEYQLNGTTNLHNDCYPIKQNVQKTYWYTIFDYGEIDGIEADSNLIAKSNEMTPATATITPENNASNLGNTLSVNDSSDNQSSSVSNEEDIAHATPEGISFKIQLKKLSDNLLVDSENYQEIKSISGFTNSTDLCPSATGCEFVLTGGQMIRKPTDIDSYAFQGKIKVTSPIDEQSTRSKFYEVNSDLKMFKEKSNGSKTTRFFQGPLRLDPGAMDFNVTKALLFFEDEGKPVLTVEAAKNGKWEGRHEW